MNSKLDYKSQFGQDKWVIKSVMRGKRNGYFVEFGADNGVALSNTYILEKYFAWQGLCVEPGPQFIDLQKNRSCLVDNSLIGEKSGEIKDFSIDTVAPMLSGITNSLDNNTTNEVEIVKLATVSLADLFKRLNIPKRIDYLSVDTEGSEFEILKSFPFDEYSFGAITVEHNGVITSRQAVFDLLSKNNYQRAIKHHTDDWYVNKDLSYKCLIYKTIFYLYQFWLRVKRKIKRISSQLFM